MIDELKIIFLSLIMVILPFFVIVGTPIYFMNKSFNEKEELRQRQYASAPFKTGDIVRMKTFGHTGMVIDVRCNEYCEYQVRFSAIQSNTNTRILGTDRPIDVAPVSLVWVRGFEIEEVDDESN